MQTSQGGWLLSLMLMIMTADWEGSLIPQLPASSEAEE